MAAWRKSGFREHVKEGLGKPVIPTDDTPCHLSETKKHLFKNLQLEACRREPAYRCVWCGVITFAYQGDDKKRWDVRGNSNPKKRTKRKVSIDDWKELRKKN